jgi:hypothetical protein
MKKWWWSQKQMKKEKRDEKQNKMTTTGTTGVRKTHSMGQSDEIWLSPSGGGGIVDDEFAIVVKATKEIGDNLVGRRLKGAVDKEKERLVGGTAKLFAQKVNDALKTRSGLQFEFVLLQLRRIAGGFEQNNYFSLYETKKRQ